MKKLGTLILFVLITLMGFSQVVTVEDKMIIVKRHWGDYVLDATGRTVEINNGDSIVTGDRIFYVDAVNGSDTNNGLTAATAFKTLDRIDTTFAANDIVALRRNQNHEGTITVNSSGTSTNPITYTSYDLGAKPKIYGSEVITGWTLHSGNIWKAEITSTIEKLFVDDVEMQLARLTDDGFSEITAVTSNSVFTPNAPVEADGYYEGCIAILRSAPWKSDVRTVTDYTTGVFTVSSAAEASLETSDGLLILNKLEFLDSAGEWFYDTAADTVYLWKSDSTEPTDTEVRGSTLDTGIDIGTNSYVHVRDLNLKHFRSRGITSAGVGNPVGRVINNNVIEGSNNGIYLLTTTNVDDEIKNNQILNSTSYGIFTYNSGNMTIADNRIEDTGELHTWGYYTSTDGGSGIATSQGEATQRNSIKNNNIINSGYNGIFWRGAVDIFQNYVYQSNMVKSDGGSIYTASSTSRTSTVTYNIVDYSLGPINGSSASRTFGEGLYIDEGAIGVTVEYNTSINNSANGIFLHKPDSSVVRYNTVFNNLIGFGSHNTAGSPTTVSNNTFITGNTAPYFYPRQLLARYLTTGITFSNNKYVNGLASDLVFSNASGVYRNLADWQTLIVGDAGSTYDGTDLLTNETQDVIYNEKKAAKTFYLNNATYVKDEDGDTITTSFILQPYTSQYVRGVSLDCIINYEDIIAPVVSAFTIESTSDGVVAINSFVVTGNPTEYIITESAVEPQLYDVGWVTDVPTQHISTTEGSVTLYAWARDEAGNISSALSDEVTVTLTKIGNQSILALTTSSSGTLRGYPVTMTENGYITSIVVYHSASTTDNMRVGIYDDSSSNPSALLGQSLSTALTNTAEWQEIKLIDPVYVENGQVVWISWAKSGDNSNMYYAAGSTTRANKAFTYGEFPSEYGSVSYSNFDYSLYAKYAK